MLIFDAKYMLLFLERRGQEFLAHSVPLFAIAPIKDRGLPLLPGLSN
jgi:hypothetical protein